MRTRQYLRKKASLDSEPTPVQNQFQTRPFAKGIQARHAGLPVANLLQTRPFGLPNQTGSQQQDMPDLQTQLERTQRFGYNAANIPIFAPEISNTPDVTADFTTPTIQKKSDPSQPTLRFGSNSPAVATLQQRLVELGASLSVDGIFGAMTQQAVLKFQKAAGLTPDGIVGKQTWSHLNAGDVIIASEQKASQAGNQNALGKPGKSQGDTQFSALIASKLQAIKAALQEIKAREVESVKSPDTSSQSAIASAKHQGWFDDEETDTESTTSLSDQAISWVGQQVDSAKSWGEDIYNTASDWVGEQVDSATAWGEQAYNTASEWVGEQVDSATNWVEETYNDTQQWVEDTATSVEEGIDAGIETVKTVVSDVQQEINELAENLRDRFKAEIDSLQKILDIAGIGKPFQAYPAILAQLNTILGGLQASANNTASGGSANTSTSKSEVTVKESTWKIKGSTIADVGLELDTHASTHGEAAHVERKTEIVTYDDFFPNNTVKQVTMVVPLERVLPEWPNAQKAQFNNKPCPCWTKEWNRFYGAISSHEEEHVKIYKKHLEGIHPQLLRKTTTAADKVIEKAIENAEKEQTAFDTKTDHGKKATPSTNFNAGVACDQGCS